MNKTKPNVRFWISIAVFSLIGQVAWVVENMYFNVFIYKMFRADAADISAMVAASAVTATVTCVVMGALSDRWGKRKALMCGGYLLWGISIFSFVFLRTDFLSRHFPTVSAASLGITLTVVMDCVMTFFGSTANDAAFNAYLTDCTDKKNRGAAEGINAMMPLVAILAVFGSFMFFDLNSPESWSLIFAIIGTTVCAIGLLGIFLVREAPIQPTKESVWRGILHGFLPKTALRNASLYKGLFTFALFNISIQIFMPYLILYYEVSLGMTNYVLIMAPAIVLASVFTAFWGKRFDRAGFFSSALISLCLLLAGYGILFFTRSTLPVFSGSLLMMCGYLSGMAVFGAVIREKTPVGAAGKFQGIRIFSQVLIPGVVGPWIGKAVLSGAETVVNGDGTTSFVPSADIFLWAALVLLPVFLLVFRLKEAKKRETAVLTTPFEEALSRTAIPFSDYPRPQLVRDSYLCLNGAWDFSVERDSALIHRGTITVPFPPESRLSGVEKIFEARDVLIYRKSFSLPEGFCRDRVILHFGAVDQLCEVFFNEISLGSHEGGYTPFSFDVTPYLTEGENTVSLRCTDPLSTDLPYGKQTEKPGGMWYTKVSGIWQTVWMESVPETYIQSVKATSTQSDVNLEFEGGEEKKRLILQTENGAEEFIFKGDLLTLSLPEGRLWSPEDPFLYRFTVFCGKDRIQSYFALRTVGIEERKGQKLLCLNGKPYYFHGILDQGYYPDGIFLPASSEGYRYDILKMKECGYNMLRKHIKLEPALFYYECDRLGMAVFQDMINTGNYSFFWDTALPTLGIRKGISHQVSKKARESFLKTAKEIQDLLRTSPCVVYYTVFNEGWGQFSADECYRILKKNDPTRIYDSTSGWFGEKESDVVSEHIYFKKIHLKEAERPTVLSEFGGYSYKPAGHCFNEKDTYGYRFFKEEQAFRTALTSLYDKEVLPFLTKGLGATVLTQLSDVEDETNGLLSYDRRVCKVDCECMRKLAERAKKIHKDFYS